MTSEHFKEWERKSRKLEKWLRDRGALTGDINEIPADAWDHFIEGRALFFIFKMPCKCCKCGRRHVRMGIVNATQKPLEKLFRKTKNKKSNT